MTNDEFKIYLRRKLEGVVAKKKDPATPASDKPGLDQQEKLLRDGLHLADYSPGRTFRRFRRNFERALARQGVKF